MHHNSPACSLSELLLFFLSEVLMAAMPKLQQEDLHFLHISSKPTISFDYIHSNVNVKSHALFIIGKICICSVHSVNTRRNIQLFAANSVCRRCKAQSSSSHLHLLMSVPLQTFLSRLISSGISAAFYLFLTQPARCYAVWPCQIQSHIQPGRCCYRGGRMRPDKGVKAPWFRLQCRAKRETELNDWHRLQVHLLLWSRANFSSPTDYLYFIWPSTQWTQMANLCGCCWLKFFLPIVTSCLLRTDHPVGLSLFWLSLFRKFKLKWFW